MPVVATVAGIAIQFFYDDHEPPHFHLRAADFTAKVALADFSVIEVQGRMRPQVVRAIRRWAMRHTAELSENWFRARRYEKLARIED
jgi:hypothetical protein